MRRGPIAGGPAARARRSVDRGRVDEVLAAGGRIRRVSKAVHHLLDDGGALVGPIRAAAWQALLRSGAVRELQTIDGRFWVAAARGEAAGGA